MLAVNSVECRQRIIAVENLKCMLWGVRCIETGESLWKIIHVVSCISCGEYETVSLENRHR